MAAATTVEELMSKPAFPGAKGFLVMAKHRGMRNVTRESLKRLKLFIPDYCRARGLPVPPDAETEKPEKTNGVEESTDDKDTTEEMKEKTEETEETAPDALSDSYIKFGPQQSMYDNCCFVLSKNLEDPGDFVHFAFNRMADDPSIPTPRFPLRIMPVQEICCVTPKAMEVAMRPLLEKVFGGEEAIRFSIIFHGKQHSDSLDISRAQVQAIVRNIIWAVNPNCVQCIKYQDYAVLLEMVDPILFVGVAKEFNMLGRYNTMTIRHGRDLKESMEDSEDDISDDPELSEAANIKMKLKIKKKRRAEKYMAEGGDAKQVKMDDDDEEEDDDVEEMGQGNNEDEDEEDVNDGGDQ